MCTTTLRTSSSSPRPEQQRFHGSQHFITQISAGSVTFSCHAIPSLVLEATVVEWTSWLIRPIANPLHRTGKVTFVQSRCFDPVLDPHPVSAHALLHRHAPPRTAADSPLQTLGHGPLRPGLRESIGPVLLDDAEPDPGESDADEKDDEDGVHDDKQDNSGSTVLVEPVLQVG